MPAFVGDVHGRSDKLAEVLGRLATYDGLIVLLGDYVDYGHDSRGVLELLVAARSAIGDRLVLLEGNHDRAFRLFLEGGDLGSFLAIGGVATVRSYVASPRADISDQFREAVPSAHLDLLKSLDASWENEDLIAIHQWPHERMDRAGRFVVVGHYRQADGAPRVTDTEAYIDTCCGLGDVGTLTCFLFPEREWFSI